MPLNDEYRNLKTLHQILQIFDINEMQKLNLNNEVKEIFYGMNSNLEVTDTYLDFIQNAKNYIEKQLLEFIEKFTIINIPDQMIDDILNDIYFDPIYTYISQTKSLNIL